MIERTKTTEEEEEVSANKSRKKCRKWRVVSWNSEILAARSITKHGRDAKSPYWLFKAPTPLLFSQKIHMTLYVFTGEGEEEEGKGR